MVVADVALGYHDDQPFQKGEVVVFSDGKTGTVVRAYQMEDKYAVKALGASRELRGENGAFVYFSRRDLKRAVPLGPVEAEAGLEPAKQQRVDNNLTAPAVLASMQTQAQVATPEPAEPSPPPGPKRLEGKVKWYLKEKGFGKIEPKVPKGQPPGEDVFVHKNQMDGGPDGPHARAVMEGTRVTYELTSQVDGKPCACNVRVEGLVKALAGLEVGAPSGTSKSDLTRHLIYSGLRYGSFQEKGAWKASMEDRLVHRAGIAVDSLGTTCPKAVCAFFGVFDGHSGASCSDFLCVQLDKAVFECLRHQTQRDIGSELAVRSALLAAFRTTEHNYFQYANKLEGGAAYAWATAGSTACTCMFFGPDEEGRLRLAVANAGDSRIVLGRRDGSAVRLSMDHQPDVPSERKRIEQEGGAIAQVQGIWRIVLKTNKRGEAVAGLSVSRGFGDLDYKQPVAVVSAVPDVTFRTLNLREDSFIMLGSDGIWNSVSDSEAARIVASGLREAGAEDPSRLGAQRLVETAHQRDPSDDKTVLVVWFGDVPAPPVTVVSAPARVASRGPAEVGHQDMFGTQPAVSRTSGTSPAGGEPKAAIDTAQLDDLFATYEREIAQGKPALDAAKQRALSAKVQGPRGPP